MLGLRSVLVAVAVSQGGSLVRIQVLAPGVVRAPVTGVVGCLQRADTGQTSTGEEASVRSHRHPRHAKKNAAGEWTRVVLWVFFSERYTGRGTGRGDGKGCGFHPRFAESRKGVGGGSGDALNLMGGGVCHPVSGAGRGATATPIGDVYASYG
jgi:hypothetical protein